MKINAWPVLEIHVSHAILGFPFSWLCCSNNCNVCLSGVCSSCIAGFTLTGGLCCPNNCLVYSNGVCTSCTSGYYLLLGTYNSCSTGCTTCSSALICTACTSQYTLTLRLCCPLHCLICVAGICSLCNFGYSLSLSSGLCIPN